MWHWYSIAFLFIGLIFFLRWWLPFTLSGDSVFTINETPSYYAGVITDKLVHPRKTGPEVLDETQWTDYHKIHAVDTHMGNGYTVGLVKAEVNMTMEQFSSEAFPYLDYLNWTQLRSGLLEKIELTEGVMRFSKSSFFNITNLLRVALTIPTPHLITPNISVHFMETSTFILSNSDMLYVYMYEQRWGSWWKRLMHPKLSTQFLFKKNAWLKSQLAFAGTSSVAKTYYSVTPFQLWDHFMKLALFPSMNNPSDTPANATNAKLRETFRKYVGQEDIEFDLMIQVSEHKLGEENPSTPMEDLSVDWIVPWMKIGTVRIPRQEVAVDSGLSRELPLENSKVLFMNPCNEYHPPVEPVGKFRCALYPRYDAKRQRLMLNRTAPQCPFANMAHLDDHAFDDAKVHDAFPSMHHGRLPEGHPRLRSSPMETLTLQMS